VVSDMNKQMDFSERLRAARNREGMSRSELAQHAGVRKSSIKEWETTDRNPRSPEIRRLEDVLGVVLGRDLSVTDAVKREPDGDTFGEVADLKIRKTTDYDRFVEAGWQREIDENRAQKMADSNEEVDAQLLRLNPIIVQPSDEHPEKFAILDGQHRFASARILGAPVFFLCDSKGRLQPEDISSMNQFQDDWNLRDFCGYHAYFGREDYQYVIEQVRENEGVITPHSYMKLPGSTYSVSVFESGDWAISEENRRLNERYIEDLQRFLDIQPKLNTIFLVVGLGRCWVLDDWDHDRFMHKVKEHGPVEKGGRQAQQIIEVLKVYNKHAAKDASSRIYPEEVIDRDTLMNLR